MYKKICVTLAILIAGTQIFCGCGGNTNTDEKLLRVYVRADSDSAAAQAATADVAAAIEYYLVGAAKGADTYEKAYDVARSGRQNAEAIAVGILRRKGYGYGAVALLTQKDNACDALVVRLGKGDGNARDFVLYPSASAATQDGAVYASLIAELIGKIT